MPTISSCVCMCDSSVNIALTMSCIHPYILFFMHIISFFILYCGINNLGYPRVFIRLQNQVANVGASWMQTQYLCIYTYILCGHPYILFMMHVAFLYFLFCCGINILNHPKMFLRPQAKAANVGVAQVQTEYLWMRSYIYYVFTRMDCLKCISHCCRSLKLHYGLYVFSHIIEAVPSTGHNTLAGWNLLASLANK